MSPSRRATLLHNPSAGDAHPTADDLQQILRQAGFQVHYRSMGEEWKNALDGDADLLVAAGGDGTVGQVAREIAGRGLPLGVLPGGTANNIARTLQLTGDARQIVGAWRDATPRPFDLGVVATEGSEEFFVEAFGGGVFAQAIVHGDEEVEGSSTLVGGEIDRAVVLVRKLLEAARPERWEIELDGRDRSGDYVAVEAMNIRFIGPSVPLAPDADTGDGMLDFALIGDNERNALLAYLEQRVNDASAVAPEVPIQRARQATIRPPHGTTMHVDDEELADVDGADDGRRLYEIGVKPGALSILPADGATQADE